MIIAAATPTPLPTPGSAGAEGFDAVMLAAISGGGGVLLTILAGLIGAWIQGRREHTKWQRDQRLRSYGDHLAAMDRYTGAAQRGDLAELPQVASDVLTAIALVRLVGPDSVYAAANAFLKAAQASAGALETRSPKLSELEDARLAARSRFIDAARETVGIKAR